ncbi:DegT/DnrJ/EryC1/StrS family aminotransferase [Candidatus Woesearchaeota archaeon]|nr:DegT/DnrJ/EryC1/StrS family aminotransferase [Candidatus Woesearchaeota archaeon]
MKEKNKMDKRTHAMLKNLTDKEHIKIVPRGNKAILYALRIGKKLGKTKVFIQDQGGWITYKQFPKKLKLKLIELKTDYGILNIKELKDIGKDSVLLINSMPGYAAEQDMVPVYRICKNKNCLLINDISGSIGTRQAKYGDISVCSFGNDKPLNYGCGGLLAVRDKGWLDLTEIKEEKLGDDFYEKLLSLEKRLASLKNINTKIKDELKRFEIIHRNRKGINVIVKFNNEMEKEQIEGYCKKNKYEYTLCPRYIRVNCDAVSIEVKRL